MTTTSPPVSQAEAEDAALDAAGLGSARWRSLGTSAQVLVTEPAALADAMEAVKGVLEDVDKTLSRFRIDSELIRLNRDAGAWQSVSPLAVCALRVAIDAAKWTDGLVDPTVGSALISLGYDRTFLLLPADGPTTPVVVAPVIGWQCLELDDAAQRVRWPEGVVVDLGATAKGLAADLAAAAAQEAADCGVLVNLGGDMAAAGAPPAGGWSVLIGDQVDPERPADDGSGDVVALLSGGLATSGIAARRWRRGGNELHHLLDPRTGRPTTGPWRTVSVTAATAVLANTASTGAIVAGADAPAWLEEHGFSARLVAHDGSVRSVGGWPTGSPVTAQP
jgi:thiamine biosynthesis lipoprotein ApbE